MWTKLDEVVSCEGGSRCLLWQGCAAAGTVCMLGLDDRAGMQGSLGSCL